MIPMYNQVSRSIAKVKGQVGLPNLIQLVNPEGFAQQPSNIVSR